MAGMGSNLRIPILLYHSISDSPSLAYRLWTIPSSLFALHLEYLQSHGYVPVTISKLVSIVFDKTGELPEKPVVLTFDDGLADFYSVAMPILKKYGFPTTIYIPTAYINRTSSWSNRPDDRNFPILSWSQIQEIADLGIECGSHGNTHKQLDILPVKKMWEEVKTSKDILELHLQRNIESFAYPYGLNCASLRKYVQQAGYSSGCAVKHSMMTNADNRYALARIIIKSDLSLDRFQEVLTGKGLRKSNSNERVRTKIYRYVRIVKSKVYMK